METAKDIIRPFVPSFIRKRRMRKLLEKIATEKGLDYSGIDLSHVLNWRTEHSKLTREQFADTYNLGWKILGEDKVEEQDIHLIIGHIPDGTRRILDAGCGEGTLATALSKRGWEVTAIDCSDVALSLAKENAKSAGCNIECRQCFLESLPFPDKSFDIVVCSHTLEHVTDLNLAISELKRVCRKAIIIVVPIEKARRAALMHVRCFTKVEDLESKMKLNRNLSLVYRKRRKNGTLSGEQIFFFGEL